MPIPSRAIEASTGLLALLTLATGLWAMAGPRSFYLTIAPFPPLRQHLIHDIGAFQIGLGSALVAGLLLRDALTAVLAGNALGAGAHVVSHVLDLGQGGHITDLTILGALALLLTALTLARLAGTRTPRLPAGSALDHGDRS